MFAVNSMGFSGLGDAPPVTAVGAPPTLAVLNLSTSADMTAGGTWSAGDAYRVLITNCAVSQPVSLNGAVVGQTSNPDGSFTYNGTVQGSAVQNWAVPGGSSGYASVGNLAPLSRTYTFSVADGGATTSWFTQTSIDSIPNWGLVAGGVVLLVLLMSMGGRR